MRIHRAWQRSKFWLSGGVLIASAWYFYASLHPRFPAAWPEQALGPVTATPTPADTAPPYRHGEERLKDFSVRFCHGCVAQIRMAYLSVGRGPQALDGNLAGVLHGNDLLQHVHVPYPVAATAADRLWLTVEDWRGRRYHAAWTLDGQIGD